MSDTDLFTLAAQLGILKYLLDKLGKLRKEDLGPQAVAILAPGARFPIKIGGELAGWLSVPQPYRKAKVTSEAQFLAWARKHAPTEVVQVEQVRESFTELVLKSVKDKGGWLDKSDGEYKPVPGVTVEVGDPYPKVDPADDAEAIIARAWRSGDVDIQGMLALPSGAGNGSAA